MTADHTMLIGRVLDDLRDGDLDDASARVWSAVHQHPPGASCACPILDGLAKLYELGYRLERP